MVVTSCVSQEWPVRNPCWFLGRAIWRPRCTDVPPTQRPRGYGGVAITWNKSLSHMVRKLPDITARIVAIAITRRHDRDICLIGAYLPCRGSSGCEAEFDETVHQLAEICDKYTHSHDLIIAADFIVNLTKASPRQSRHKSMMMERCQLSTFNCPDRPTFVHYNGLGSSQIDFIIGSQHLNLDVTVHDSSPLNTSTHVPVEALLHSNQSMKCPTPLAVPAPRPRIQWDKVDILAYRHAVLDNLSNQCVVPLDKDTIDEATSNIISCLLNAAPIPPVKRTRNRPPWSESVSQAMKTSRREHRNWVAQGSPGPLTLPSQIENCPRNHFVAPCAQKQLRSGLPCTISSWKLTQTKTSCSIN